MPAYCTEAEFTAYVEGWVTDDAAALARLLERASRDIDRLVGPWEVNATTGFKFLDVLSPLSFIDELEAHQVQAIKYATAAQAEYRVAMGEEFFVRDQYDSTSGPDFSASGRLSKIGPKVWSELQGNDLLQLTGRIGGSRREAPWRSFAINTDCS